MRNGHVLKCGQSSTVWGLSTGEVAGIEISRNRCSLRGPRPLFLSIHHTNNAYVFKATYVHNSISMLSPHQKIAPWRDSNPDLLSLRRMRWPLFHAIKNRKKDENTYRYIQEFLRYLVNCWTSRWVILVIKCQDIIHGKMVETLRSYNENCLSLCSEDMPRDYCDLQNAGKTWFCFEFKPELPDFLGTTYHDGEIYTK
jgi:hypothetical protein